MVGKELTSDLFLLGTGWPELSFMVTYNYRTAHECQKYQAVPRTSYSKQQTAGREDEVTSY